PAVSARRPAAVGGHGRPGVRPAGGPAPAAPPGRGPAAPAAGRGSGVTRGAQPGASHGVPLADLADLAGLGAYFAVASHDPAAAIAAPWLPLDELTGSVRVLRDRIAAVRSALGAAAGCGPRKVESGSAASVPQRGIAARLISPPLGLAVTSGALLRVAPARWQPTLGGAFPLSLPAGSALRPGTGRDDEDALAA